MNKLLAFLKRNLLAAGTTTLGKGVEHAAVAAGSLGVSLLLTALAKGNLDLSGISTIAVIVGTTFLAGVRAALKQAAAGL